MTQFSAHIFLFILFLGFATRVPAQNCPDLFDSGSPLDGITTISVVTPEADCTDPLFAGWRCMTLRSAANNNGLTYDVIIAWNLPNQPVRASFVWASGGGGDEWARRVDTFAAGVQDELAARGVRTIDTFFSSGDRGYLSQPANGTANVSAVIVEVLEYLISYGVADGRLIGACGSSTGSQLFADALAYHHLDELIRAAVFGGGPFWVDLEAACLDVGQDLYAGPGDRAKIDQYHYAYSGITPCQSATTSPTPPYFCRSTLGPDAQVIYPNLRIANLIGTDESRWKMATSSEWRAAIRPQQLYFDAPAAPHVIFETEEGAADAQARLIQFVDELAPTCAGDLNYDGVVDLSDLGTVLAGFGCAGDNCPGDIDHSGATDLSDLGVVLSAYGIPCP